MIRNEIHMFLNVKNIVVLLAAVLITVGIYQLKYIGDYHSYEKEQQEIILNNQENVTTIVTKYKKRIEFYEENKKDDDRLDELNQMYTIWLFFQSYSNRMAEYWKNGERHAEDLLALSKELDTQLLDASETIDLGEDILYRGTKREWNQRMLLHQAYDKSGTVEPINEKKPTGAYVLMDALSGNTVFFLLLILLLLIWNYDIWAGDFDDSTYKLLFTQPCGRSEIFRTRVIVHWIFSMLGCVVILGALFLTGTLTYGIGMDEYRIINQEFLQKTALFQIEQSLPLNSDTVMKIGAVIVIEAVLAALYLTLFFLVVQFCSFLMKSRMATTITMAVVLITAVSKAMFSELSRTDGMVQGVVQKLNIINYYNIRMALMGNTGTGMHMMILLEIVAGILIFAGTSTWMKHREL